MEYFGFLLCAMGLSNSMFFDGWNPDFDVIGDLPLEISTMILRLLDGKTLLSAALVCKKWWRIIRSDRVLRQKVRDELRARRMASIYYRPGRQASEVSNGLFSRVSNNVSMRLERRAVEVAPLRMAVNGKKRKFQHELGVSVEKRRKADVQVTANKKKVEAVIADIPRLTKRLR